ncbi:hypothetical protein HMSSN139_01440 [Paenibacillus sp. HMSSN-139]|nr:hypothetical protein HMSSN139_01440 [Paenibacillus sp. HMSSN-139]
MIPYASPGAAEQQGEPGGYDAFNSLLLQEGLANENEKKRYPNFRN